jgi:hypothetical protein
MVSGCVLNDLGADVAIALQQPFCSDGISQFVFFNRAQLQNSKLEIIPWLVENY